MVIVIQTVLSVLVFLVGSWLWGLARSLFDYRWLLRDRVELIRVLAHPSSQAILDDPSNAEEEPVHTPPFAELIAVLLSHTTERRGTRTGVSSG